MAKNNDIELLNIKEKAKQDALATTLASINKKYGPRSIYTIGNENVKRVACFGSGSLSLNKILNGRYMGGYPEGRIVEIFGPEGTGKTTLAIHAVAEAQKMGKIVAFVDVEQSFNPVYARKIGVDVDKMLLSQPSSGEEALDIAEELAKSGALGLIIIDSVAALVPQAELDGDMGDSSIGLQARLMSKAMRRMTAVFNKSNCTGMFLNQLREKVGISYGNPEVTPGGRALKFYATIRLDVRKKEAIKRGTDVIGHQLQIKTAKNKIVSPFKAVIIDLMYDEGFNSMGELLQVAIDNDVIIKAGAWFSTKDGERIGQGGDVAKQYIRDNEELQKVIFSKMQELDNELDKKAEQ